MIFDRVAQVAFAGIDLNPVTDLRIQFAVDKHDGIQLNRGVITIFNLGRDARNLLARPYPLGFPMIDPVITVFLKAGYLGNEVQMFAGDLMSATNRRDGPDWITTLQLFSGFNAATQATAIESFADKTPARTVADRMLAPLNIDVFYTDEAAEILKNQRVSAFSESALSFRAASDFLNRYGLAFTIEEDAQGLVYVDDRPRDPESGKTSDNTISPDTGLIGTPEITSTGIRIQTLLRPSMKIMQRFYVESETLTATLRGGGGIPTADYHITRMSHSGDTRGESWYTDIEGSYSDLIEGEYAGVVV